MNSKMEDKKYILSDEIKNIRDHILHRIRAVRDFGDVKAGDLGGWIEKEENLSHNGNCWVYGNAKVFGNARVFGNASIYRNAYICEYAKVLGNAEVYGNAWIHNYACVMENARILEDAWVYGNSQVYGNVMIRHNAKVYGNVEIYGNAKIFKCADVNCFNDYITIGPIGSRNDFTTFYHTVDNDIWVCCGCFNGSIEDFKLKVIEAHGHNIYAQEYLLACQQAELRFSFN